MKRIDLMTLYQPHTCLDVTNTYIKIENVSNHKDERLCRTKGNVNFTDLWFAMQISTQQLCGTHSSQSFGLLSETNNISDNDTLWSSYENCVFCVCLIKVKTNNKKKASIDTVQTEISKTIRDQVVNYNWFRTMDNADLILIFSLDLGKTPESIVNLIKNQHALNPEKDSLYCMYSIKGDSERFNKGVLLVDKCKVIDPGYLFENSPDASQCKKQLKELSTRMTACIKNKDKKMLAYYQGLAQVINTLAQYENKNISKDLFFIFFPIIQLFLTQLNEGLAKIENASKTGASITDIYRMKCCIEDTFSQFLNSLELLIYHMGHSCPNILNAEGRNGLPYDIPIRFCLLYIAYLGTVTEILNDNDAYNYEYCLSPITYSRPMTTYFDFNLEPTNRLINVQISRHAMFMPRALLEILAHEVCHYVGEQTRLRIMRAGIYSDITGVLLTETILPNNILNELLNVDEASKFRSLLENGWILKKEKLVCFFQDELRKKLNERKPRNLESIDSFNKFKYHFARLSEDIKNICDTIVFDQENLLDQLICEISPEQLAALKKEADPEELLQVLTRMHKTINTNKWRILGDKTFLKTLTDVRDVMKEVYADLGAILLLDLEPEDYLEAYVISESYMPSEDTITNQLLNRISLVVMVMCENNIWTEGWAKHAKKELEKNPFLQTLIDKVEDYISCKKKYDKSTDKKNQDVIYESQNTVYSDESWDENTDIFKVVQVIDYEKDYLLACYQELQERIQGKAHVKKLLIDLYRNFKVYEKTTSSDETQGTEPSVKTFFEDYAAITMHYKKKVKKRFKNQDSTD